MRFSSFSTRCLLDAGKYEPVLRCGVCIFLFFFVFSSDFLLENFATSIILDLFTADDAALGFAGVISSSSSSCVGLRPRFLVGRGGEDTDDPFLSSFTVFFFFFTDADPGSLVSLAFCVSEDVSGIVVISSSSLSLSSSSSSFSVTFCALKNTSSSPGRRRSPSSSDVSTGKPGSGFDDMPPISFTLLLLLLRTGGVTCVCVCVECSSCCARIFLNKTPPPITPFYTRAMTNNTNTNNTDKKKTNPEEELYYCEKELRALGKSLECCVCIRLMESPSRTRWYYSFCVSSF